MKKIIILVIFVFLIFNSIILATKSSDEYLDCLSEKLYNNCKIGVGIFKSVTNGFEVDYYIEPLTKQSILDWLKNYETQFTKTNVFPVTQYVLRCIQQDDAPILRRDNFEIYTLDYTPIKCPTVINKEQNFIKFQYSISFFSFSPFSINFFPITITLVGGILVFIIKKYKLLKRPKKSKYIKIK